jgi:hypothetical protein
MAGLFSRYESGLQFTAGEMVGSIMGTSGLNPLVDRLNSIADSDGILSSGCVAYDHGASGTAMVTNICYGTSITPPPASGTPIGTIYIQYTE